MKTNKKLWIIIGLIVMLGVIAIGVYKNNKHVQNDNVIRIGAILPASGGSAVLGVPKQRAFEMAVSEWNESNSPQIKLVYGDSKGNAKDGVAAFQKVISEHSILYSYVDLTTVVNSVVPIIEGKKIVTFAGSAEPGVADVSKYLFRLFAGGNQEIDLMVEYLCAKDVKKVFVLHTNELYGNNAFLFFSQKFIDKGGSVVGSDSYPMNNVDFKSSLAKAKIANSDKVLLLGYGNEYATLLKQAVEMGIKPSDILCNLGGSNKSVIELPKKYTQGLTFVGPKFSFLMMNGGMTHEMKEFVTTYKRRYGEVPDFRAAYAYDAIMILIESIAALKDSSTDNLCEKIRQIQNYQGVSGKITFLSNGEALTELVIARYDNGRMML